jgi:hypothetical protein
MRGLKEQIDRRRDGGGTDCVTAKVTEAFLDSDDGAAPARQAKMHEADRLFR